jgi:hypothetical protein
MRGKNNHIRSCDVLKNEKWFLIRKGSEIADNKPPSELLLWFSAHFCGKESRFWVEKKSMAYPQVSQNRSLTSGKYYLPSVNLEFTLVRLVGNFLVAVGWSTNKATRHPLIYTTKIYKIQITNFFKRKIRKIGCFLCSKTESINPRRDLLQMYSGS